MTRPLLPLAPLAPAVAIIALAAASAAAESLVGARNALEDVQIGEEGRLLRVAVLCREECRIAARAGGVFFIPGIAEDIDVDLSGKSALARGLSLKTANGGSALRILSEENFTRASVKPCALPAGPATCIDLEFPARLAAAPPPAADESAAIPAPPAAASLSQPVSPEPPPAPALRETTEETLLTFARFAPPERLAPPPAPPGFSADPPSRRPVIRPEAAARLLADKVDIAALAGEILHKGFGPAECEGAEARLRADAWALKAMIDVGFCKAKDGDLNGADRVFERLLEYTPDNYEALVGRALIAAKEGDRPRARRYFQDALNALPPIEESDRIVEVMQRL